MSLWSRLRHAWRSDPPRYRFEHHLDGKGDAENNVRILWPGDTVHFSGTVLSDRRLRRFRMVIDLRKQDGAEAALSVTYSDHPGGALADVLAERRRQIEEEGWTADHDDRHASGEMALAAAAYAFHSSCPADEQHPPYTATEPPTFIDERDVAIDVWPWDASWWKPKNPRRDLVRAAALILAEIERLDRAASREPSRPPAPAEPADTPPRKPRIRPAQPSNKGAKSDD